MDAVTIKISAIVSMYIDSLCVASTDDVHIPAISLFYYYLNIPTN